MGRKADHVPIRLLASRASVEQTLFAQQGHASDHSINRMYGDPDGF